VTFADNLIKHSAGPQVTLARDAQGRITQILAPDGTTWLYQYNPAGDLVQVTYPGPVSATFAYSTNRAHFLDTINDPLRDRASGPNTTIRIGFSRSNTGPAARNSSIMTRKGTSFIITRLPHPRSEAPPTAPVVCWHPGPMARTG